MIHRHRHPNNKKKDIIVKTKVGRDYRIQNSRLFQNNNFFFQTQGYRMVDEQRP